MVKKAFRIIPVLSLAAALAGCDDGSSSTKTPGGDGGAEASTATDGAGGACGDRSGTYKELEIMLPDINDDDVTITSKTDHDLHILCFWAVWCTPCQAELAKMGPMWEEMKDRGLNIYAISIDGPDSTSRVPGFAQSQGYKFPVLLDRETEVLAQYNPKGDIPFYVILDADGNVVKSHQGYVKGDMVGLKKYLDTTLPKCDAEGADAPAAEASAE